MVWGGGKEQSLSISRFLGNSGKLSELKQIVHILSYLERLFHSVISNSVVWINGTRKSQPIVMSIPPPCMDSRIPHI